MIVDVSHIRRGALRRKIGWLKLAMDIPSGPSRDSMTQMWDDIAEGCGKEYEVEPVYHAMSKLWLTKD